MIDKAGNIRLDNLNAPADVQQVIRDAAAENDDFQDARRGVVSDAQVIQLADALGMTPESLSKRKIGQAFNAEQVMAARKLLVQSAITVRDLMAKAAGGSDADVAAYAEARARHLMIQEQVSGITAEAGRALRAFRDLGKEVGTLSQFLQENTGRTLFQLRREAQMGMELDTAQAVSKFVHDAAKPSFLDGVFEYFVNAILSNPNTHATYLVANEMLTVWKVLPETALAATLGAGRRFLGGEGGVYGGEAGAGLYALFKGQRDGFRAAWRAVKSGVTEDLPGENTVSAMGALPQKAIPGVAGEVVRAPSRMIAGIHSYSRSVQYQAALAQLAYRQAATEGLAESAFVRRVAELTADPPEALMDAARQEANATTLMSPAGPMTRALRTVVNTPIATPLGDLRPLKYIDPFVTISSNVLSQALLERSPLGVLSPEIRANLMGRNGAAAADMQRARILLGSSLMMVAGGLAAEGLLSGAGPSDPRHAAVWRLAGNQPYSVRIGDTWYAYHRLGPLGMMLGIAGDMHDAADRVPSGDMTQIASLAVISIAKSLTDESFMRGPSDLMRAIEEPDRFGKGYADRFLASFVPFSAGMAQMARATDPYARQARGLLDTILSRVPGASETVLPRRDLWGQPIANLPDLGGLTSIMENRVNRDPVNQALLRLNIYPGMPRRTINNVKLSDDQYDELTRVGGQMAHARLAALVGQPGFTALPEGAQTKAITGTLEHAREAAETMVKMRHPEIIQQAMQARAEFLQHGRPPR